MEFSVKKIKIADISLRESEQVYAARLSFKEKLETAKLLEKLQIDVIETGPVGDAPADAAFIRTLASTLDHSVLCVPVTLDKQDVNKTWNALSKANKPRLNLIVPTSTVQMEYQHQIKASMLLPLVSEIMADCAALCEDVEFTAVDSVRSEPEFLAEVLKTAIGNGAKTITLCDSVGELLPEELSEFIASVYVSVPELSTITLALHCKDSLGLAAAAALSAVKSGVSLIKVSSGAGFGTLSLEQFLNVVKIRGETLGISSNINTTALQRTCAQLAALTGVSSSSRISSDNNDKKADETALPEDADIEALRSHISALGYDVSEDDLERIFVQFEDISRNKTVVNRDIEALIAETAGQTAPTYQLKNYVINSGSAITATACIELSKDGTLSKSLSAGDGPIDAAFKAVEQILGAHYELEEFQIQAVTGGREATGDALVKLRHGGKLYSGRGVSTDIVGASIRAYISAVNKIVYDK
jgi:2-isopropylmalate synthase